MRGSRGVAVLFTLALVAGACSSGGGAAKGAGVSPVLSTPDTAASPAGTSPPTTSAAAMVAKAQGAVLQTSDFPPGFQPQADAPGEGLDLERLWGELTSCLGVANAAKGTAATSPTFLRGLATQARATVEYAPEPTAAAVAAALGGPKFQTCAKESFGADVKRSAPEGAVPGPVAIAPASAPPAAAKAFTYRINVTLDLEGLKVPLFQDFVVVLDRGAVIRMLFLSPGSEFPQDLERSLIEKVLARA